MVQTWNSNADAVQAATTAAELYSELNSIPKSYAIAVQNTLRVSRKGSVQAFWEELMKRAPKAAKFFQES